MKLTARRYSGKPEGGYTPPLRVITSDTKTMNDDNTKKESERRRDITLNEQRLYSQLDEITTKLESIIRLEERQIQTERRVDEHGVHLAAIIRDQNSDRIKIARLEGVRNDVDSLINKYKGLETKQTSNTTLISLSTKIVTWIFAILMALGLWSNFSKPDTVNKDTKQGTQQNGD